MCLRRVIAVLQWLLLGLVGSLPGICVCAGVFQLRVEIPTRTYVPTSSIIWRSAVTGLHG
jgi:hypothetical protein